ncbi:MAG: hypothetical protein EA419_02715 [Wenzhouxiangella sp.]|nr:MAG: hypothetical protein EA419_02715 [Wenzhouxiangella sp.]
MNKVAIVAVFAVFLLPVVTATLMHSEWFDWQPGGTRNHGDLVQPVIELEPFRIETSNGEEVVLDDLLERWQLLYYQPTACNEACMENLYWLRQVRRAQDRHQPDVGLVFLTRSPLSAESAAAITALADDFVVLAGTRAEPLISQLPDDGVNAAYYIVDPMANIILRFAEDSDHNHIRRDLRRLLTWTQRD